MDKIKKYEELLQYGWRPRTDGKGMYFCTSIGSYNYEDLRTVWSTHQKLLKNYSASGYIKIKRKVKDLVDLLIDYKKDDTNHIEIDERFEYALTKMLEYNESLPKESSRRITIQEMFCTLFKLGFSIIKHTDMELE